MRNSAIFLFALLTLCGCASISAFGNRQVVLVQSDPPGAGIVSNGEVVAHTPHLVTIKRAQFPKVVFRDDEGDQTVHLKKHYRWGASFFSDLIFYTAAPIAWLVDLGTGTAWQAEDPPVVKVKLAHPPKVDEEEQRVAIAPPQGEFLNQSDAAGEAIESVLRAKPLSYDLLPFHSTLPVFVDEGYDFDGAPPAKDRRELYNRLDADDVYESRLEDVDDGLLLKVNKTHVSTNESTSAFQLKLKPDDRLEQLFSRRHWWSRLLPNTVGLAILSESFNLASNVGTYALRPAGEESWWAAGLGYLDAIEISNTLQRRPGRSSRFEFGLIPNFRLSRIQVRATGLPDDGTSTDQVYVRWLTSAGYGPELGYQIGRHYVYIDVIPVIYWNEIVWNSNSQDHSVTSTGINLQTEVGYLALFDGHWALRLFARNLAEDSGDWSQALSNRLPTGASGTLKADAAVGGISLGYRFEPELKASSWKTVQ